MGGGGCLHRQRLLGSVILFAERLEADGRVRLSLSLSLSLSPPHFSSLSLPPSPSPLTSYQKPLTNLRTAGCWLLNGRCWPRPRGLLFHTHRAKRGQGLHHLVDGRGVVLQHHPRRVFLKCQHIAWVFLKCQHIIWIFLKCQHIVWVCEMSTHCVGV